MGSKMFEVAILRPNRAYAYVLFTMHFEQILH